MISHQLQAALCNSPGLDAALDLEELLQRKETDLQGVELFATALEQHALAPIDRVFFAAVFARLGITFANVDEVAAAYTDSIRELRSISTFRSGDFARMKDFCLAVEAEACVASMLEMYRKHALAS